MYSTASSPVLDPRDEALFVEFFYKAVYQGALSEQEGRPIHKQEKFIRITTPGAKTVIERKVSEQDKQRFARRWEAFERGEDAPQDGMPLEQWPLLGVDQVADLKALKIYTVEQLAAMSDAHLHNIGLGGRQLRAKAQAFIDAAKGSADITQLAAENERLKEELKSLKAQIEDLGAKFAERSKRKRGKVSTEDDFLDGIELDDTSTTPVGG